MPDNNYFCKDCIGDDYYLHWWIKQYGGEEECDECNAYTQTANIEELVKQIEPQLTAQILITDNDFYHPRYGYPEGDSLDMVFQEMGVEEKAAKAIADKLFQENFCYSSHEYGFYDPEKFYELTRPSGSTFEAGWQRFKDVSAHGSRYFNPDVRLFLDRLFLDNEIDKSLSKSKLEIGPDSEIKALVRAREFNTLTDARHSLEYPDKQLGAAPIGKSSAGRMNTAGSSVFYGALDDDTALAEIRPSVGGYVVSADFMILRDLKILDFRALAQNIDFNGGSHFDPDTIKMLHRQQFLNSLGHRLSKPIMPTDTDVEYKATQMVANYIQHILRLDGIAWSSSQFSGGTNFALFYEACRTNDAIPETEHLESYITGDQIDEDTFVETGCGIDRYAKEEDGQKPLTISETFEEHFPSDTRTISLCVNLESMRVHRTLGVKVSTEEWEVNYDAAKPPLKASDTPF